MSLIQLKPDDMRGEMPPIKPTNGVFICGGAIRRWFTGKEGLSDIDVFAPSKIEHDAFLSQLPLLGAKLVLETKNANTYLLGDIKIQLIKFYFPNLELALNGFDFNICQFGWNEQGIFATQEAIIGTLRGHLAVNKIRDDFAADSLRRAFKYQLKGFVPCAGTIRDLATAFTKVTPEQIQAQVAMSPGGGNRIVRFD